MMMMVSANDLISLYLGLELQSLALYVVAAFRRDTVRSTEAGLKYFVLGALASGMLLYGASLVYGFAGTTNFAGLAKALTSRRRRRRPSASSSASCSSCAGPRLQDLGGAVPHVDARRLRGRADAGHRLLRRGAQGRGHRAVRARHDRAVRRPGRRSGSRSSSSSRSPRWCSAPSPRSARRNIKRLMAYSSIGHVGYALVGLAAGTPRGRPRRAGLHGDLPVHEPRHLRRHPGDAPEGPAWWRSISDLAGLAKTQPRLALRLRGLHVLDGRHPAARRLLRQALRLPRRGRPGPVRGSR